jgi:hypothetical protein
VIKRYLRKIYIDPMTGKTNWGLLLQGDQILGVYSQSKDKPLKIANFQVADATFADSNAYSDWRFVYAPLGAASAGQAALGADTQLSNAAAPNFNTGGTNVAPPGATSPMGPAPMGGMPQDSQVCNAARASDFRACAGATKSGETGVRAGGHATIQLVHQRRRRDHQVGPPQRRGDFTRPVARASHHFEVRVERLHARRCVAPF